MLAHKVTDGLIKGSKYRPLIKLVKLDNYYRPDRHSHQLINAIAYSMIHDPKYRWWYKLVRNACPGLYINNLALLSLIDKPLFINDYLLIDYQGASLLQDNTLFKEELRAELIRIGNGGSF